MRLLRFVKGYEEGKYLLTRRDGTNPEWPHFTLGARDPAAPFALRAYADAADVLGMDPEYAKDIRTLADKFEEYRMVHGSGDPDGAPHREDDPKTIELMKKQLL